jgi:hypothetical protein
MTFCLRRREFIAALGGAAAWPLTARAQQRERVRRVGVLSIGDDPTGGAVATSAVSTLRDELAKLGWAEGRNRGLRFASAPTMRNASALTQQNLLSLAQT